MLEKLTRTKAWMMEVEMEEVTWTQTEDGNTQGGGNKTVEDYTNRRDVGLT